MKGFVMPMALDKMDNMIEMARRAYQSAMKSKDHIGASDALRVLLVLEKEKAIIEDVANNPYILDF